MVSGVEKTLYKLGWVAVGTAILLFIGAALFNFSIWQWVKSYRCPVHALTGWYCPGCGVSRALEALLNGNVIKSICYHPAVIYILALFSIYMVSHTIGHLSGNRVKGLRFRLVYVWILAAIITVNFIIKNAWLLIAGIDLLKYIG